MDMTSSGVEFRTTKLLHLRMLEILQCEILLMSTLVMYMRCRRAFKKTRNVSFSKPRSREVMEFESIDKDLTSEDFRAMFRMTRAQFYLLMSQVTPFIEKYVSMGRRSKRIVIPPDTRLAMTLRYLAGGDKWEFVGTDRVGRSTIHNVIHDTLSFLNEQLKLPPFPKTDEYCRAMALKFKCSRKLLSPLSGCIGTLDGIAIEIKCPPKHLAPACFYNRKGFYALNVQAVVDSDYMFRDFSARVNGSNMVSSCSSGMPGPLSSTCIVRLSSVLSTEIDA